MRSNFNVQLRGLPNIMKNGQYVNIKNGKWY